MEMEFKDRSRRRRLLVIIGLMLAVIAGAAAYALSSQGAAQAPPPIETRRVLVGAREIPARTVLTASDLTLVDLPAEGLVSQAIDDPQRVIGLVTGVPIYLNQPITPNLLATGAADAAFSILAPEEAITAESPVWRAVSVTVPTERAVGGQLLTGQRVDLISTVQLDVLTWDPVENAFTANPTSEGFHSGRTTKVTFEDVELLSADAATEMYVLKVNLNQAEEISHLQAEGTNTFSLVLRPESDTRALDRTQYGETTERIIEQYRFVVPKVLDLVTLQEPVAQPAP